MGQIFQKRQVLTLKTPLDEIPLEWLRYIEPKIVRGGYLPCWIWNGPVISYKYPAFKLNGKMTLAQNYIMKLFFDYDDEVYLHRCPERINCMNPSHMLLSNQHYKQR